AHFSRYLCLFWENKEIFFQKNRKNVLTDTWTFIYWWYEVFGAESRRATSPRRAATVRRSNHGKLAKRVALGAVSGALDRGAGGADAGPGERRPAAVAGRDDDAAAVAVRAGLDGRGGLQHRLLRLAGRRPGDGRRG